MATKNHLITDSKLANILLSSFGYKNLMTSLIKLPFTLLSIMIVFVRREHELNENNKAIVTFCIGDLSEMELIIHIRVGYLIRFDLKNSST